MLDGSFSQRLILSDVNLGSSKALVQRGLCFFEYLHVGRWWGVGIECIRVFAAPHCKQVARE